MRSAATYGRLLGVSLGLGLSVMAGCEGSPMAIPSGALRLEIVAGEDTQQAVINGYAPIAPSVRVVDDAGNGVPGVRVTWAATLGSGFALYGVTLSNATGHFPLNNWRAGPEVGPQTLTAVIAQNTTLARVDFHLVASP